MSGHRLVTDADRAAAHRYYEAHHVECLMRKRRQRTGYLWLTHNGRVPGSTRPLERRDPEGVLEFIRRGPSVA